MAGSAFAQYTVSFDPGEIIYHQGDEGHSMFVINEGRVALIKEKHGKQEVISDLSKGDFFGELSILESIPRPHTARAVKETQVVIIHRETFMKMLKANMEIAVRLLQKFSSRLREREEKIEQLLSRLGQEAPVKEQTIAQAPPEEPPKPAVTPLNGRLTSNTTKKQFLIRADKNLVGRFDPATGVRPEVDLWYEDDKRSVSRRHAIIVRKDNRFYVAEEIGALNGTFVNGEKVGSKGLGKEMKHGDHVNFGMLSFQFELLQED